MDCPHTQGRHTALSVTIEYTSGLDVVKALLAAGADVNAKDDVG